MVHILWFFCQESGMLAAGSTRLARVGLREDFSLTQRQGDGCPRDLTQLYHQGNENSGDRTVTPNCFTSWAPSLHRRECSASSAQRKPQTKPLEACNGGDRRVISSRASGRKKKKEEGSPGDSQYCFCRSPNENAHFSGKTCRTPCLFGGLPTVRRRKPE